MMKTFLSRLTLYILIHTVKKKKKNILQPFVNIFQKINIFLKYFQNMFKYLKVMKKEKKTS